MVRPLAVVTYPGGGGTVATLRYHYRYRYRYLPVYHWPSPLVLLAAMATAATVAIMEGHHLPGRRRGARPQSRCPVVGLCALLPP